MIEVHISKFYPDDCHHAEVFEEALQMGRNGFKHCEEWTTEEATYYVFSKKELSGDDIENIILEYEIEEEE